MFSYRVNREFYVKFTLTLQAKIAVNIIYLHIGICIQN